MEGRSGDDVVEFGEFEADLEAGRLRSDGQHRHLAPQEWALLDHLLRRPGQLVTKQELLDTLWPGEATTEYALSRSVRRLRLALGDDARRPRFLQTEHGRGFRWIAQPVSAANPSSVRLVDRDGPIAEILDAARRASTGTRSVVLVEGEAGAGKSALVRHALDRLDGWQVVRAVCLDVRHAPEPFGPLLDALERFAATDTETVIPLVRRYAPTWLAQMPWLAAADDRRELEQAVRLATRARMLREFTGLIEQLTANGPLVLFVDDMHWADPATVDVVGALAEDDAPARMLMVACQRHETVRRDNASVAQLTSRLTARRRAERLRLAPLALPALAELVTDRLEVRESDVERLAQWLHTWTGGNPLFVVSTLDRLAATDLGDIESLQLPNDVRQVIDQQVEALAPEALEPLEAASLVGDRFALDVVAAAVGRDPELVERMLAHVAATSPVLDTDGDPHRPAFTHAAYRSAVAARVGPIRARRLHRAIADALVSHAERPEARTVAHHLETAGSADRAVPFLLDAARTSLRRFAHADALDLFTRALDGMGMEESDRRLEIDARLGLALCQLFLGRSQDDRTGANIDRLQQLVVPLADEPSAFSVWQQTLLVNNLAGRTDRVRTMAPVLLRMATERGRDLELMDAHHAMSEAALHAGDLDQALHHLDIADSLFNAAYVGADPAHRQRLLWIRDSGARIKSARAGLLHLRGESEHVMSEIVAAQSLCDGGPNTPIVRVANPTICASILFLEGESETAYRVAGRVLAEADDGNEDFVAIARLVRWATGDVADLHEVREVAATLIGRPAIPFPLGPRVFLEAALLPDEEMAAFADRVAELCARVRTHWCDDVFAEARNRFAA